MIEIEKRQLLTNKYCDKNTSDMYDAMAHRENRKSQHDLGGSHATFTNRQSGHALFLVSLSRYAKGETYYVDPTYFDIMDGPAVDGPKENNGRGGIHGGIPWKTISHAATQIIPEDTVYIKKSVYNESVSISISNVKIIGYEHDPGDLDNGQGVPGYDPTSQGLDPYDEFKNNPQDNWDKNPIIDGGDPVFATGIRIEGYSIEIRNFGVRNCRVGVYVIHNLDSIVKNVVISEMGDKSSLGPGETGRHHGWGIFVDSAIHLEGHLNTIENCFVYNSAYEGIGIHCRGVHVKECRVYCDDNSSDDFVDPTDYYINLNAASSNGVSASDNLVENCHVERRSGPNGFPYHGGHGFVVLAKGILGQTAERNVFRNCTAVNIDESILIRGAGSKDNRFEDIKSTVTVDRADVSVANFRPPYGGISIYTGPSENRFSRIRLVNPIAAVFFTHVPSFDGNAFDNADMNLFENCIFEGFDRGVAFRPAPVVSNDDDAVGPVCIGADCDAANNNGMELAYKIKNTKFINCNFVDGDVLITANRLGQGNKFINCIIKDVDGFAGSINAGTVMLDHDFEFTTSIIHSAPNDFPLGFFDHVDFDDADYNLFIYSNGIDDGTDVAAFGILTDFDGDLRSFGGLVDIGAQERAY